ncbi:Lsr2 family protein [Brooklawnia cerclae]|uniref:Lsr2 family protein n=1 Tax=Brooklawnia cerclae TaxID=349934 RepID=A0ABX0SAZ9_9ACTN|nr:Lsr2 family protein [Brooklawnia cerclae]NIH55572.1 hypothetical protein [Brooklawnia cerclae]
MAQRVEYILVDDLDQTAADETVRFSLDGVNYEIDLSSANAARLREGLAGYIGSARRNGGRRARAAASTKAPTATQIRAWAADNGFDVSARGRVPANIRAAYERAHA